MDAEDGNFVPLWRAVPSAKRPNYRFLASGGILRRDVVLKMLDGLFLFRNKPFHEVTDCPHPLVGHSLNGLVNGLIHSDRPDFVPLADRVFDVIGEVLSLNDINLPEILREAANDPRRLDEYLDQIERVDPKRLLQYEEATGIALARANVDFSGFQTANAEAEERRLMIGWPSSDSLATKLNACTSRSCPMR